MGQGFSTCRGPWDLGIHGGFERIIRDPYERLRTCNFEKLVHIPRASSGVLTSQTSSLL